MGRITDPSLILVSLHVKVIPPIVSKYSLIQKLRINLDRIKKAEKNIYSPEAS